MAEEIILRDFLDENLGGYTEEEDRYLEGPAYGEQDHKDEYTGGVDE